MAKFILRSLAFFFLTGCAANPKAVPETVALEAGTSVRHEVGESAAKINTVNVKAVWRLR